MISRGIKTITFYRVYYDKKYIILCSLSIITLRRCVSIFVSDVIFIVLFFLIVLIYSFFTINILVVELSYLIVLRIQKIKNKIKEIHLYP